LNSAHKVSLSSTYLTAIAITDTHYNFVTKTSLPQPAATSTSTAANELNDGYDGPEMISDLSIPSVKAHLCLSLANTYTNLPILR
jgi:hypothetical protein